jgi:predicted nucleic acid-binding protein
VNSGYVFDSHALMAFFQNEEGAEVVDRILRQAREDDLDRLVCVINLGEMLYSIKRRFGDYQKIQIFSKIGQLGIHVLSVSDSLVFQAAEYKADYSISYADCFALACAVNHSLPLVTGDPEFRKVSHLINIEWIR